MSTKSSFSLIFYINRTKEKKNGECPVMLRININGVRLVVTLKRFIKAEDWDQTKVCWKGKSSEAKVFNAYLDAIKVRAQQKYNELLAKSDQVTPILLRDEILGINSAKPRMLLEIWDEHIANLKSLIGKENTYSTYQKHSVARNHVQSFLKKHYRLLDIGVKSIDHYMLTKLALYIKTEKNCNYNTTIKILQHFKRIVILAMRNGWLNSDPFEGMKLSTVEVDRPYLTEEEMQKIMNYDSKCERLNRIRDFFIFSCFTGLAYIDVQKLKKSEIEFSNDAYWIRTRRQKTDVRSNIPLLKVPLEIIHKYADLDALGPEDKVLPISSNQKVNAYLKELADICGITKQLSFHIARHTFATTVTMMNGVPIESVSKMLGHKNIRSTQHYAKIVDQKVGDDMITLSQKLGNRLSF